MWIDQNGYVYVGDRQGNDALAPVRPANTRWDQATQSWKPFSADPEDELDIIKEAAKFLLENVSIPIEKQTERDQLKTKLSTKRRIY